MPLRPLGWLGSILLFGVPCLIVTLFLFVVLPAAVERGATPFQAFHAGFMLPLAMMLVAALVAYRLEGRPMTWASFRERYRLQRMDRATWLWTAGLVVWLILWMEVFPFNGMVRDAFAWLRFYEAPAGYAAFMGGLTDGETQILGLPFSWGLLLYFMTGMFIFNILGEELWWRGYILPRQELVFGARTWVIHGTLWALFHFFYHTNLGILVSYLPTTLGIAYVCQRTRNTWPGIIGHMVSNMMLPLLMLSRLLAR